MTRLIAEKSYWEQTEARKLFALNMDPDDDLDESILIDRKILFRGRWVHPSMLSKEEKKRTK